VISTNVQYIYYWLCIYMYAFVFIL